MKLSAPIYLLKSRAKDLKKSRNISLSKALDEIASREGYATWSLLNSKRESLLPNHYSEVLDFLNDGDLVLVAARPSVGKTSFTAGLLAQAFGSSRPISHLFTIVERERESRKRIDAYIDPINHKEERCNIDCSDDISADYIITTLADKVRPGTLIVVDYLQMMDEKRSNPPIQEQIVELKKFSKKEGCTIIFLCQLGRQIGDRLDQRPKMEDIRLPNPLDLDLFNKIIFLYRENVAADEAEVSFAGKENHTFKVSMDKDLRCFSDLI